VYLRMRVNDEAGLSYEPRKDSASRVAESIQIVKLREGD
jgi:hypothetical protein